MDQLVQILFLPKPILCNGELTAFRPSILVVNNHLFLINFVKKGKVLCNISWLFEHVVPVNNNIMLMTPAYIWSLKPFDIYIFTRFLCYCFFSTDILMKFNLDWVTGNLHRKKSFLKTLKILCIVLWIWFNSLCKICTHKRYNGIWMASGISVNSL